MIGDLRTDALHEALARAPIEDDTLMALLVLAFAGQNVRVDSGEADGSATAALARQRRHLFDAEGKFAFEPTRLRIAARGVLIDVLSCREKGMSKSGVVALVAGEAMAPTGSSPTWARRTSSPVCRVRRSKARAPTRRCCRVRG